MKKIKTQKGITLIALIITIIVLLILAVVTINAIQGDGIIQYASNASDNYQEGQVKESTTLSAYEQLMENVSEENKLGKAPINKIVDKNSTIDGKLYSSNNPVIPAGFKAINVTGANAASWNAKNGPEVSKGLVISDGNSEFVWVPVSKINDMIMCQVHGATVKLDEKTLKCPTCKENTKLAGKLYATNIENNFSSATINQAYGLNTGLREPDVITAASGEDSTKGTNYDYEYLSTVLEGEYAKTKTIESFKLQLQNEFDNMAKSVAKYGGFYVGRYETSLTSAKTAQSKYGEESSNATKTDTKMWYGLYTKSKTYVSTKSSVKSTMIWGSQYDAMMRWIANGNDVIVKSDIGNNRNKTRRTGTVPADILNNVCDLYGNSLEWTMEAYNSEYRLARGGHHGNNYSPSYRLGGYTPTSTHASFNSRMSLYVL